MLGLPRRRLLETPVLAAGVGGSGVGGGLLVHLLCAKPSIIWTKDVLVNLHPCFWNMGPPARVVPAPQDK